MNQMRRIFVCALSVIWAPFTHPAVAGEAPALVLEKKIPLGDVTGRIDHLAYDAARQRLYVAELGNDSVGIVDLNSRQLIRTVTGFDEPQGVAYELSTDTVYVANGGDGSLQMFRGADFAPVDKIALGADADNVRVDPATHRVYVGYGGGAIAVIDANSRKRIADISLKGHPESFQLEATGQRIFVNVPDAGLIQVASREAGKPIASWSTEKLRANYPMAYDASEKHLLVVFRQPARLEAFDTNTGNRLGGVDACADADDIFTDPKRGRVYVVCGAGTVDTYASDGNAFSRAAQFATTRGSRTGLFLPAIDRLVVAVRGSSTGAAAIWVLRPIPSNATEVVMVCEHGNVKSLMAASYFNELAQARHLPFHAVSRGTAPNSTTVPPLIVDGLRSDGFDVSAFQPTAITAADVAAADRVILINTELASDIVDASKPAEKWADVPPASADYAAAREALKTHVRALLDQLSSAQHTIPPNPAP